MSEFASSPLAALEKMNLTATEEGELHRLLHKLRWPLTPPIFRAWAGMCVTVPIELAVLDSQNRVGMFYRKDDEYDGNHMPGTVVRDNDTVAAAITRLKTSELIGANVSDPIPIGWVEIAKGNGSRDNPTRHEVSLVHVCRLQGEYVGKGMKFYAINDLPPDTLPHHRTLVEMVQAYLRDQLE